MIFPLVVKITLLIASIFFGLMAVGSDNDEAAFRGEALALIFVVALVALFVSGK